MIDSGILIENRRVRTVDITKDQWHILDVRNIKFDSGRQCGGWLCRGLVGVDDADIACKVDCSLQLREMQYHHQHDQMRKDGTASALSVLRCVTVILQPSTRTKRLECFPLFRRRVHQAILGYTLNNNERQKDSRMR